MASTPTKSKDLSASVAEARSKVQALARAEWDRYRQLPLKRKELFEAQEAQDFRKAAELREQVDWLEDAESGRRQRRDAITAYHLLQVEELEQKVAVLRARIAEREIKTKALLAEIQDHENIELRQKYLSDLSVTQQLEADASAMALKASLIRQQAEHGEVDRHGDVQGDSLDGLIEDLMRIPEVIGPPIGEIYERAAKSRSSDGLRPSS